MIMIIKNQILINLILMLGFIFSFTLNDLGQSTFDSSSGANEARSKSIVSWLNTIDLPHTGKLLDIGCGNGAFLKAGLNVFLSVVLCLAATWLGISLGRQL